MLKFLKKNKKLRVTSLVISHILVGVLGFAVGVYTLPILIAPDSPTEAQISEKSTKALYHAEFKRELKDSDAFHWGEGLLTVGEDYVTFKGELAPGPDYKLYLSPEFVETEDNFNRLKTKMLKIGEVKTFDNFVVAMPENIDLNHYNSVIVWCESFGEFITSAKFK